jgi:hypothetical protein
MLCKNIMIKQIVFGIISYIVGVQNLAVAYDSFHQIPRTYNYCSKEKCLYEGNINCINTNEYKCVTKLTGYEDQYNIYDPRFSCSGQTSCSNPDDSFLSTSITHITNDLSNAFKVYVPAGSVSCNVVIYGIEQNGQAATVSQFGKTPDCDIPDDYNKIPNNYTGFTIREMTDECKFVKNNGGLITVANTTSFKELNITEGGWLYIKILSYDGSTSNAYKYGISFKVGTYKTWYISSVWLDNGDPTELSVSPASRSVEKGSNTTTFVLSHTGSATIPWKATVISGGDWLRITSGSSGNNAGIINCIYDANTGGVRTGVIRISASGGASNPKDVKVVQATATSLSVTPDNINVKKETGTAIYEVANSGAGTMPWTAAVTSGSNWLKIQSGTNGSNAGKITCSFDANTNAALRTGTIRITASGAAGSPKDVTVTQAGTLELSVSPSNRFVAKGGATTTFDVSNTGTGTMSWTAAVTSGGNWLKIQSGASGSNVGKITCSYDANTDASLRTGTIRVTATGAIGSPKDVMVTQEGTLFLSVAPEKQNLTHYVGETSFNVSNTGTGTMSWKANVTSDSSWLKIKSGSSGSNTGNIICTFDANNGSTDRIGIIRVSAEGAMYSPKDVQVIQAPQPSILKIAPINQNVTRSDGTTTFNVINDGKLTMPWNAAVTSDSSWLKITSGSSGKDAGTITCSFEANTNLSQRTGTIRITAAGASGSPKDVTITQGTQSTQVPYTGLTKCYDAAGNPITCPNDGMPFFGQDANNQINSMSYGFEGEGKDKVIKDKVTGLIWELKTKKDNVPHYDDPHDANNIYTWYDHDPATNGGNPGTAGVGSDTEDFINQLNDANNPYGGYSNWRLPTVRELNSIVNYNKWNQTVNADIFINIQNGLYLTATSDASDMYNAWGINFSYGENQSVPKGNKYYVMAVSDGKTQSASRMADELLESAEFESLENATAPVGHYVENDSKTAVTDTSTGLMWEKAGSAETNTWEESLTYCAELREKKIGGYSDWRMPTIKELSTLADYSRNLSPTINPIYFPNCYSNAYWTGTSYTYDPRQAWFLNFTNGESNYNFKSEMNKLYVRCVRSAQKIMVTPIEQIVNSNEGKAEFYVYTTVTGTPVKWTATVGSGNEWLSITSGGSETTGDGKIQCSYKAKNITGSRTGTILVTVSESSEDPIVVKVTQEAKISILGIWSDGIWAWRYATGKWTKMLNTESSKMVASGKVYSDADEYDDLIGVDDAKNVYTISSSTGEKKSLASSKPTWIVAGDINGDKLDEIIGNWPDGVKYLSDVAGKKWQSLASSAKMLATGNIAGTALDDLAGVWSDGLWVRNSKGTVVWQKINAEIPVWIAAGDMATSTPKQADIIGSYRTSGTWYRNSANGAWVKITTPAEQLASADVDGDGLDDLIGIWSGGLYVRYAANNRWQLISSSKPSWISTGTIKY